jgi:RHS repeat-associated protein
MARRRRSPDTTYGEYRRSVVRSGVLGLHPVRCDHACANREHLQRNFQRFRQRAQGVVAHTGSCALDLPNPLLRGACSECQRLLGHTDLVAALTNGLSQRGTGLLAGTHHPLQRNHHARYRRSQRQRRRDQRQWDGHLSTARPPGSVIAAAPASGPLTASTEYDPFGIVTTVSPNVIDWANGLPANGWLGTHQRATQFGQPSVGAAGPIEMGVRVYLPKVGRFLQPDPIDGGSANAYDYAFQDPTNMTDLNGLWAEAIGQGLEKALKEAVQKIANKVVGTVQGAGTRVEAILTRCFRGTSVAAAIALGDHLFVNHILLQQAMNTSLSKSARKAAAKRLVKLSLTIPRTTPVGLTVSCLVG